MMKLLYITSVVLLLSIVGAYAQTTSSVDDLDLELRNELRTYHPSVLPGDALYPAKLAWENIRVTLSSNENKAILHYKYSYRRVAEMSYLIQANRTADLEIGQQALNKNMRGIENSNAPDWVKAKIATHLGLLDKITSGETEANFREFKKTAGKNDKEVISSVNAIIKSTRSKVMPNE